MQTLLGNTEIDFFNHSTITPGLISKTATCVGSVVDEQNNSIHYFIADPENFTDYILQYNSNTDTITPIVVDKYKVIAEVGDNTPLGDTITHFLISDLGNSTGNITNVRPGMSVTSSSALGIDGAPVSYIQLSDGYFILKMKRNTNSQWEVYLDQRADTSTLFTNGLQSIQGEPVEFHARRVLNFGLLDANNKPILITGINIIDGILFWTDGITEPKKIIIKNFTKDTLAGRHGTHPTGKFHSFFNVYAPNLITSTNPNGLVDTYGIVSAHDLRTHPAALEEEHATIIKKPPLHPPTLIMSNTSDSRFKGPNSAQLKGKIDNGVFIGFDEANLPPGTIKNVKFSSPYPDYVIGDLVLLRTGGIFDDDNLDSFNLIIEILEKIDATGNTKIKINYIQNTIVNEFSGGSGNAPVVPISTTFHSMLQQEEPLYEFKLPKFAYRYKYQDNQYSTYSPFSEVAFLPKDFKYEPKDGYNLAMVNDLRSVYVMDFVTDIEAIPKDVIEIDILYKESNSTSVYLIETVKIDEPEWSAYGSVANTNAWSGARTKGRIRITSEMVKSAVASNQLLRPWDNVPRTAKAQEIVGNRIVYANYLQNYNL